MTPAASVVAAVFVDAAPSVVLDPEDWELLGYAWPNEAGEMCYWVYTVMPFGECGCGGGGQASRELNERTGEV